MTNLAKKLLLLTSLVLIMLTLNSCGDRVHDYVYIQDQAFEGLYLFDNGSQIELLTSEDGEVSILSAGQTLVSVNPKNESLGSHPRISKTNIEPVAGIISFIQDYNYTDRNDLEEDSSGANIRGRRATEVLIEQRPNNGLRITIKIYSGELKDNPNFVVAQRVFESK